MIFMSQSGITDPGREGDWDRWYVEHLDIMVSVPGVVSAQRFKTVTPGHPPSLAMYSVASPSVFEDPYYQSIRGMGEWLALIDRQHYRRNLFEGLDHAPKVPEDRVLLVADRHAPDDDLAGIDWTWLQCVGIDRSIPYRGVAIVDPAAARALTPTHSIALYRPSTPCHKPRE